MRVEPGSKFTSRFAEYFQWLGIKTVAELDNVFAENEVLVARLMIPRVSEFDSKKFSKGLSMLYLCYAIMVRAKDEARMGAFFDHFEFGGAPSGVEFAKELLAIGYP